MPVFFSLSVIRNISTSSVTPWLDYGDAKCINERHMNDALRSYFSQDDHNSGGGHSGYT